MSSDNASGADNQQETLYIPNNFYYTGFCVGELSCSLIKASNKGKGFYFTPDITISNADRILLQEINGVIGTSSGIISPIKGGYNLSFRGVKKVRKVLHFFNHYPVISGDIAKRKIELIKNVLPAIGKDSTVYNRFDVMEKCRKDLKDLKLNGFVSKAKSIHFKKNSIGFFLAGIMDAEGSCGFKKSGKRDEPFLAVAMKDKRIIELFQEFFSSGHIHKRSDDGLFHWEVNKTTDVLKIIKIFTHIYPSKLLKMRERITNVERILNDYTPKSLSI